MAITKTKKAAAKKPAKPAAVKKGPPRKNKKIICIDYPSNNEIVCCGHYSFRLGTPHEAEWVKVSVNGGPWCECRSANGYWWHDWCNCDAGSFALEALALIDGEEVKSAKRRFKVVL